MLTSQTIKTIQDIMRKDVGVDGDAQRIGQLGWMIFLKILDDQEQEFELLDDKYRSLIPENLRWRNWAANPEGITGEELLDFVNNQLFRGLKNLPNGVFNPYTGIKTNILFFEKGKPTKHIWYYEHPYPPGQKSYNKTNPIRIEEFEPERKWWKKRVENEHAWKVDFKKLLDETKARAQPHWEAAEKYQKEALGKKGDEQERLEALSRSERSAGDAIYATAFNLDRKNPNSGEDGPGDPETLLAEFQKLQAEIGATQERLKRELACALQRDE